MLALYQYDIGPALVGRAPIWQVFALVKRLPFEPRSLWRAEHLGGMDHFDHSKDSELFMTIIDAIQTNTAITAHFGAKGKPKLPEPFPRPKIDKKEESKETIAALDIYDVINKIGGENGLSD